MKHKILYFFVAAAMLSACNDDLEDSTFRISDEEPAATWLEKNGYTMWTDLLEQADLFNTINLDASYTLFVPDNDAVNAYLLESGKYTISEIDTPTARGLVKYSTIAKHKYSRIDFSNDVLPDTTASGDYLTVTFDEKGNYLVNGESKILNDADIEVTNGNIFIIDKVLKPINETIADRIDENGQEGGTWHLFKELLNATGTYNLAQPNGRASYTCFVIPDSIFEQVGISTLEELADSLKAGSDGEWKKTDNAMYRFAAYHFISSGAISTNYLNYLPSTKNPLLETKAEAAYIEMSITNNEFYINYDKGTKDGVQILQGDVSCKNGLIHVIDALMTIKDPSTLPSVTWDLTDNTTLASLYPEYRLSSSREEIIYPMDSLVDNRRFPGFTSSPSADYSYSWNPEESNVSYYVAASTDTVRNRFLNSDALQLNLRQYNSITMKTPTIMADSTTYTVGLAHYNEFADEASNRITVYIDGEEIGWIFTNGRYSDRATVVSGTDSAAQVGTVKFPVTGRHDVRIEDNTGSTLQLDYMLFTPKK